jgi:hypothetical protein
MRDKPEMGGHETEDSNTKNPIAQRKQQTATMGFAEP